MYIAGLRERLLTGEEVAALTPTNPSSLRNSLLTTHELELASGAALTLLAMDPEQSWAVLPHVNTAGSSIHYPETSLALAAMVKRLSGISARHAIHRRKLNPDQATLDLLRDERFVPLNSLTADAIRDTTELPAQHDRDIHIGVLTTGAAAPELLAVDLDHAAYTPYLLPAPHRDSFYRGIVNGQPVTMP